MVLSGDEEEEVVAAEERRHDGDAAPRSFVDQNTKSERRPEQSV